MASLQFDFNFHFGIVKTSGTKRFHFYRNKYGTEIGCNLIPRRFGVFMFLSHDADAKAVKIKRNQK